MNIEFVHPNGQASVWFHLTVEKEDEKWVIRITKSVGDQPGGGMGVVMDTWTREEGFIFQSTVRERERMTDVGIRDGMVGREGIELAVVEEWLLGMDANVVADLRELEDELFEKQMNDA